MGHTVVTQIHMLRLEILKKCLTVWFRSTTNVYRCLKLNKISSFLLIENTPKMIN